MAKHKSDLIEAIHGKYQNHGDAGLTKSLVEKIINDVFAEMASGIKANGEFQVFGFGNFSVRQRAARKGRNPKTGAAIDIPATKSVGFKPAKALKDSL